MQRGLRITVAVAIAAGAVIVGAGTAMASDDNGPITAHGTHSHGQNNVGKHGDVLGGVKAPSLGGVGGGL